LVKSCRPKGGSRYDTGRPPGSAFTLVDNSGTESMRTFKTSVYVLALAALTAPTSAFAQAEDGADFGAEDSAADEPAPAPPAQPEPEPAPEPAAAPAASGGVDLNLNTTAPAASVETTSPPPAAERPPAPRTVGGPDTGGAWEFGYSGYFRA